jgi:hypothetical protein
MDIYEQHQTYIPSDIYLATPDFSVILEDISRGVLPSGTGRPFPLFSEADKQQGSEVPWYQTDQFGNMR